MTLKISDIFLPVIWEIDYANRKAEQKSILFSTIIFIRSHHVIITKKKRI